MLRKFQNYAKEIKEASHMITPIYIWVELNME